MLFKRCNKIEELYLLLLLYILEIRDFAENFSEDSKKKQLPSQNDLNPNKKFINNLFLKKLRDDSDLIKKVGNSKLSFSNEQNVIKSVYFKMIESELYTSYMSDLSFDFELDKKFIVKLFSKELIEMEVFQDFLINAGGLINVYSEINGYDREKAIAQTRKIYDTSLEIFAKSEAENITTHQAALELATERIVKAKN